MVEYSRDKAIWDKAHKTGCPYLRWSLFYGKWVALDRDPCPTCNNSLCHNVGKPFDEPDRLIIIITKKDVKEGGS